MLFFKKRKIHPLRNKYSNDLIRWISEKVFRCQKTLATRLEKYESKLTLRQKKIHFLLFCIIMGGFSSALFVEGILGKNFTSSSFMKINHIKAAQNIQLPDSLDVEFMKQIKSAIDSSKTDSLKK